MKLKNLFEIFGLKRHKCESMAELRIEIDTLDEAIVEILALRKSYMDQAASIKKNRNLIRDEERIKDVIEKVTRHAKRTDVDPELLATVYKIMIEWSINYEFGQFDKINKIG